MQKLLLLFFFFFAFRVGLVERWVLYYQWRHVHLMGVVYQAVNNVTTFIWLYKVVNHIVLPNYRINIYAKLVNTSVLYIYFLTIHCATWEYINVDCFIMGKQSLNAILKVFFFFFGQKYIFYSTFYKWG